VAKLTVPPHNDNIFTAIGEIDIVLESFPHSGGTMFFDALWMGVPAITLASRPRVSNYITINNTTQ